MHEFLEKLSANDMGYYLATVDNGLRELKERVNHTEIGNEFDSFIEATIETVVYLYIHFRKDE